MKRLHIRNYAIISQLDINVENGLTIITGETGAGKSILIGALSLVLGKRADSSVLYEKNEKCIVEAHFDVSGYDLEKFFQDNDLDFEATSIIRREINAQGKSRAFVNDTPVNLTQLKELTGKLIDIHSQHAVLTLKAADFRTRFLDACSDGSKQFSAYSGVFSKWKNIRKQVDELKERLRKSTADEDYLKFQLEELEELRLEEGELQSDQERLNTLENAEEIRTTLSGVSESLSGDNSIVDGLRGMESELQRLAKKYPNAEGWSTRLSQSLIELEDIADDMSRRIGDVDEDPAELERLQERVDEILRLMTKHHKQSEAELIQFQKELDEKLQSISNSDEQLTLLNAQLENAEAALNSEASKLTSLRTKTAKQLSPLLTKELSELGMPDAQVSILVQPEECGALGQDRIEIQFTANKGQQLQDISKVASGGELSRLMLTMKSEMAKNAQLPAIIFDEIDTGVSGEVAGKMGLKINSLSKWMQVFCITHLPQIASKADQHLFVYKEEQNGRTVTKIRQLEKSERVMEIAKMLSNANPTEAALQHAKDMVDSGKD